MNKYKRGGPHGRGGGGAVSSWPSRKIRKLLLSAERTHVYAFHITSYADIPYFLTSRSILSPACDYRYRKSGLALKIVNMHIRHREQMAYEWDRPP